VLGAVLNIYRFLLFLRIVRNNTHMRIAIMKIIRKYVRYLESLENLFLMT